jgi:hypothetical protein
LVCQAAVWHKRSVGLAEVAQRCPWVQQALDALWCVDRASKPLGSCANQSG